MKESKESKESTEVENKAFQNEPIPPELPPLPVLLNWLVFYHRQTGVWEDPFHLFQSQNYPNTALIAQAEYQAQTSSLFKKVQPGKSQQRLPVLTKTPFQQSVFSPQSSKNENEIGDELQGQSAREIGLPDPNLQKFQEAAAELISSGRQPPVSLKAQKVLGSFIGWCHYPHFYNSRGREGLWMSLPLGSWAKQLKIRKSALSQALQELETAGWIEIERGPKKLILGVPNLGKSQIYRLKQDSDWQLNLPPFRTKEIDQTEQTKQTEKPAKGSGSQPLYFVVPNIPELIEGKVSAQVQTPALFLELDPPIEPVLSVSRTSDLGEPVPSCINPLHEVKDNKRMKHEHGGRGEGENQPIGLFESSKTRAKFEFLTREAFFPGFKRSDGRATLDEGEARKFAANQLLTLEAIKQVYFLVYNLKSEGKCTRNPIGFLHKLLTKHIEQIEEVNGLPTGTVPTFEDKVKARARSKFNLKETTGTLQLPVEDPLRYTDFPGSTPNSPVMACFPAGLQTAGLQSDISLTAFTPQIKELTLSSLAERFQQPQLAKTLESLNWQFESAGNQIQLNLQLPNRRFSFPLYLDLSNLALLKLALSQTLYSCTERKWQIEVVPSNPLKGTQSRTEDESAGKGLTLAENEKKHRVLAYPDLKQNKVEYNPAV